MKLVGKIQEVHGDQLLQPICDDVNMDVRKVYSDAGKDKGGNANAERRQTKIIQRKAQGYAYKDNHPFDDLHLCTYVHRSRQRTDLGSRQCLPQGIEVDKPRHALHRHRIPVARRAKHVVAECVLVLVIFVPVVHRLLYVLLTKHATVQLVVLDQPLCAAAVLAQEVLGVIAISCMRHRTRTLNGLATARSSAERVVFLVVVVCAERFPVVHVKTPVREWFLQ